MNKLDPTTAVIVGVGQITHIDGDAPEPTELLAHAIRTAARDSGREAILDEIEAIAIPSIFFWKYPDPAALVAAKLGARPAHMLQSTDGGQSPQMLVNRAVKAIAEGDADVVVVGGAECARTAMRYQRSGEAPPWPQQRLNGRAPERIGWPLRMGNAAEQGLELWKPVDVYPIFENALRHKQGLTLAEHRRSIAELWARFSAVAATNPHGAVQQAVSAEHMATSGPGNRLISFPYTKLMTANINVDQGAALILCSVQRARTLGISSDRWVFLHAGTEAFDFDSVSARQDLASSPALRIAGQTALELAGVTVDELAHIDLYSCFPSAVQIARRELGIADDREVTVTGGLTFAGGPLNNYVTHAIATMVARLRTDPKAVGLCTAVGGNLGKHAAGVYSATPPAHGSQVRNLYRETKLLPKRSLARQGYRGPATVDSYSVAHDRAGNPEKAWLGCLLADGRRAWATSTDAGVLTAMVSEEVCGREILINADGEADLR